MAEHSMTRKKPPGQHVRQDQSGNQRPHWLDKGEGLTGGSGRILVSRSVLRSQEVHETAQIRTCGRHPNWYHIALLDGSWRAAISQVRQFSQLDDWRARLMPYRPYGNLGIQVSALGFGAMRLPKTEDGKTDMDRSVAVQYNFLDRTNEEVMA